MKTRFPNISGHGPGLRSLATAALLALGVLGAAGAAQFNSPVGTWDFVLGGSGEQGVAVMTFSNSFSFGGGYFRGYELLASPLNPPMTVDGRTPGGNPGGRTTTGQGSSTTNGIATNENVFGFTAIQGPWEFDSQGRVIGYFVEILDRNPATTNWLQTMVQASVAYSFTNSGNALQTAITNFTIVYTNSPFITNVTWTAVNGDGSTNQYSENFVLSPANAAVTLGYAITNSEGASVLAASNSYDFIYSNGPTTYADGFFTNVLATNVAWTVLANTFAFTTVSELALGAGVATNQVSFVATVVPGERMTLVSTPNLNTERITYRGLPYVPNLTDLDGNWYGTKKENGQTFQEFFALQSFGAGNPFSPEVDDFITNYPNIYYSTSGFGPGYTMFIVSMLSRQKEVAFSFSTVSDGGSSNYPSASYGPLLINRSPIRANTIGIDAAGGRMGFNATQQP